MSKLSRTSLWSLEEYSEKRPDFRSEVMTHKKHRRVALGPHATLYFEDFLTIKYQIQEMLRAERIFDASGIEEELEAYNPLIPDGRNLKATFMIEYEDVEERRKALARLVGIEHKIWIRVGGSEKVYAIANEDLERSTDEKTSAVHFLRFELDDDQIRGFKDSAEVVIGADHPELTQTATLTDEQRSSLAADLD